MPAALGCSMPIRFSAVSKEPMIKQETCIPVLF